MPPGLLRQGANALGVDLSLGYFGSHGIAVGPPQFMMLLSVTTSNGATEYYHSAAATDVFLAWALSVANPRVGRGVRKSFWGVRTRP